MIRYIKLTNKLLYRFQGEQLRILKEIKKISKGNSLYFQVETNKNNVSFVYIFYIDSMGVKKFLIAHDTINDSYLHFSNILNRFNYKVDINSIENYHDVLKAIYNF